MAQRWLPCMALLTVVLLYIVVIAGGVVRATGSGMGCPDWPRCYGRLIPPTAAEEIDFSKLNLEAYRRSWASHGREAVEVTEENLRLNFNARETWIEFINRCFGMLSGLAAMATLVCAFLARKKDRLLVVLLCGQLVLFGFVAWLGKVVVDTNLLPWKITLHMILALGLVTLALLVRHRVKAGRLIDMPRSIRQLIGVSALLLLIQIIVGTQVREMVDHLGPDQCCDGRLEEHLGVPMAWHRVGAIAVLTVTALVFFRMKFSKSCDAAAPVLTTLVGLLVAVEYGAGVLLLRAGLPALLQPLHLVLAFFLHGILFSLLLRSRLQKVERTPTLAANE